ncbi:MAG: diguanylate cyclase [Planctomycetes bacterium]|nr:diguanylate cyclase [Planctomycetota bacterium]
MAHLVFIDGANLGATVPLAAVNTIGSAPERHIRISEAGVAELHASIRYSGGRFWLTSEAPARVNGRDMREEVLRNGDVISLASVQILFTDESGPYPVDFIPNQGNLKESRAHVIEQRVKQPGDAAQVVAAMRDKARRPTYLETLVRVSSAVNATLDLDTLLGSLTEILFEVFTPDRAFILLSDEHGALRVAGSHVGPASGVSRLTRVSWSILNEVVQRREGILSQEAGRDDRFKKSDSVFDLGIQSALCAPLAKQEKVMGAIYLDSLTSPSPFTPEHLNLLNAVAAQAALAVENVLNYQRSIEYSRKLVHLAETTRRISSYLSRDLILREAVESAQRIFATDKASILLADETGDLVMAWSSHIPRSEWASIRLRKGERWAGQVFAEGVPMLVQDTQRQSLQALRTYDSESSLIVPIRAHSEGLSRKPQTLGVACVADKKVLRHFDTHDQEFLAVLGAQLGIALQNAKLFERSTIDSLTKLFTRPFFFARLEDEIPEVREAGVPLSVLMLDLDHFKSKNDDYGHAAGDAVLATAAAVVRDRILIAGGWTARFGGEEFVAALPGAPLQRASDIAEVIRRAVEARPVPFEGQTLFTTISIGAASLRTEETADALVKRADAALYAAKRAGRNRVCYE